MCRWPWSRGGTVKASTLNDRLTGVTKDGDQRNAILLRQEADDLAKVARCKNWIGTPEGRTWLSDQVIAMLVKRKSINWGRNHAMMKLSRNAKKTLERGKISDDFFNRFMARKDIKEYTPRTLEDRRYQWSTEGNMSQYKTELEQVLKKVGAAKCDDNGEIETIDMRRIFTSDECPSILGEVSRGGKGGKVIAGVGDAAVKHSISNKQRLSYDPYVTLSGDFLVHHIIAKLKSFHDGRTKGAGIRGAWFLFFPFLTATKAARQSMILNNTTCRATPTLRVSLSCSTWYELRVRNSTRRA